MNESNQTVKNMPLVKLLIFFISVGLLCGLDFWTKRLASTHLVEKTGDNITAYHTVVILKNIFELHYLENTGAVFGIMQGQTALLILVTILISAILVFLYFKIPCKRHYVPLLIIDILITSGAIGNMIDRIARHYVIDFFYFKLINFPIFNVADIYVTCSAFALIILGFTLYRNEEWDFMKIGKKGKKGEEA